MVQLILEWFLLEIGLPFNNLSTIRIFEKNTAKSYKRTLKFCEKKPKSRLLNILNLKSSKFVWGPV